MKVQGHYGCPCNRYLLSVLCLFLMVYLYVMVWVTFGQISNSVIAEGTMSSLPLGTSNLLGRKILTSTLQGAVRGRKFADPSNFETTDAISKYYGQRLSKLRDLIALWPPEQAGLAPAEWIDLVPRFDWLDESSRAAALRVRQAEKPFVIANVPSVVQASIKWTDEYLESQFSNQLGKVEKSETNSFMYWTKKRGQKGLTEYLSMSWSAFKEVAKKIDFTNKPSEPHFYWHTQASGKNKWIADDLKLFDKRDDFFIVDKDEYTVPIACRVGSRGLCNENHYDTHRTFAAQIVGSKRWIFMLPSSCKNLYLYPQGHISARHSAVDINSGHINETKFPLAGNAMAIDTVIHAGEVGYLPSNWFHHIISQEFNVQCIARSGHSLLGDEDIEGCGFNTHKEGRRKKNV